MRRKSDAPPRRLGNALAHEHQHGDHGHSHGPGAWRDADRKALLIAAGLTAGFMVAEVVGGLLTDSLALLADAGHMLSDTFSLFLALGAVALAARPVTARRRRRRRGRAGLGSNVR
ncbi:MAG TPA: cation transporter [Solirubrobacterales bacterium]|nr:cation transporter [Solirubrobacterales bacterium]